MVKKNSIPERWRSLTSVGQRVPGSRFIAFKVPLKGTTNQRVTQNQKFTPKDLVSTIRSQNEELGIIIDLTNTERYYTTKDLPRSVQYVKLHTAGLKIPDDATIHQFKRVVRRFLAASQDNDKLIGVHCTTGINRTGYLICRFLIDVEGWKPLHAISAFAQARGHPIEGTVYIEDLVKGPVRSNVGIDLPQTEEEMRALNGQDEPARDRGGRDDRLRSILDLMQGNEFGDIDARERGPLPLARSRSGDFPEDNRDFFNSRPEYRDGRFPPREMMGDREPGMQFGPWDRRFDDMERMNPDERFRRMGDLDGRFNPDQENRRDFHGNDSRPDNFGPRDRQDMFFDDSGSRGPQSPHFGFHPQERQFENSSRSMPPFARGKMGNAHFEEMDHRMQSLSNELAYRERMRQQEGPNMDNEDPRFHQRERDPRSGSQRGPSNDRMHPRDGRGMEGPMGQRMHPRDGQFMDEPMNDMMHPRDSRDVDGPMNKRMHPRDSRFMEGPMNERMHPRDEPFMEGPMNDRMNPRDFPDMECSGNERFPQRDARGMNERMHPRNMMGQMNEKMQPRNSQFMDGPFNDRMHPRDAREMEGPMNERMHPRASRFMEHPMNERMNQRDSMEGPMADRMPPRDGHAMDRPMNERFHPRDPRAMEGPMNDRMHPRDTRHMEGPMNDRMHPRDTRHMEGPMNERMHPRDDRDMEGPMNERMHPRDARDMDGPMNERMHPRDARDMEGPMNERMHPRDARAMEGPMNDMMFQRNARSMDGPMNERMHPRGMDNTMNEPMHPRNGRAMEGSMNEWRHPRGGPMDERMHPHRPEFPGNKQRPMDGPMHGDFMNNPRPFDGRKNNPDEMHRGPNRFAPYPSHMKSMQGPDMFRGPPRPDNRGPMMNAQRGGFGMREDDGRFPPRNRFN